MGNEPGDKKDIPADAVANIPVTENDDLEEEDFDFFIKDLQRIIDESPPGMQARFARTINYLKEKKKTLKSLGKLLQTEDKKEIYHKVLKLVDGELETNVYSEDKFQNVLSLVKLREELAAKKVAENPSMPPKIWPQVPNSNGEKLEVVKPVENNFVNSSKVSVSPTVPDLPPAAPVPCAPLPVPKIVENSPPIVEPKEESIDSKESAQKDDVRPSELVEDKENPSKKNTTD
jgi:hypothetical protein